MTAHPTTIAPHQPAYIPWLGYLARFLEADIFVYMDDAQFEDGGWQNRNYILSGEGPIRLTVPVRKSGRFAQPINETAIHGTDWRDRHLRSLAQAYGREPYWPIVRDLVMEPVLLNRGIGNLADLNICFLEAVVDYLGISVLQTRTSDLATSCKKAELLDEVAALLEATSVVVGAGAPAYLGALPQFRNGVEFRISNFRHPAYPQTKHSFFVANLSCIDLLVREDSDACRNLLAESVESS